VISKQAFIRLIFFLTIIFHFCIQCNPSNENKNLKINLIEIDSTWVLSKADKYLAEPPISLTDFYCERSLGGRNDFYSEGDYWWPNPEDPDGPYIRKDGMTNPENFVEHRKAMRRMSIQIAALVAAYKITKESKYSRHAIKHLHAWFIDDVSKMSPHMKFAQAIKGRVPGRGVGLIDGIHLVEPARAISVLANYDQISDEDFSRLKGWFSDFLTWMTTHEYGIDERERKNNHGTCWTMQAAEFARLTENDSLLNYCRERYKTVLLPNQMAGDGSFPLELARTKPYGYSLFNLDAMATVCHILSTSDDNLWDFHLGTGKGIETALQFMFPFIKDKSTWQHEPDVMYFDQWPIRHPSLLFGGIALNLNKYIDLWKTLTPEPWTEEGFRNFPIRQPVLWID
jgi:hypothetical protein